MENDALRRIDIVEAQERITFKGTRHGVLVSISEENDFSSALTEFRKKIEENRNFFLGAGFSLDLGWREMTAGEIEELLKVVEEEKIRLQGLISASLTTRTEAEKRGIKVIIGRLGLADHRGKPGNRLKKPDEKDKLKTQGETLLIKRTLRSGQQVDFSGNIVIVGDVNPGAAVKAGGDIVVMGILRGAAFAGAECNRNAQIIAYQLKPSQLRIADLIGFPDDPGPTRPGVPVLARVREEEIITTVFGTRE